MYLCYSLKECVIFVKKKIFFSKWLKIDEVSNFQNWILEIEIGYFVNPTLKMFPIKISLKVQR